MFLTPETQNFSRPISLRTENLGRAANRFGELSESYHGSHGRQVARKLRLERLGVPVSRQGGAPPTVFTSATWLDEHTELQTRIRTVRADINKRDALSDRGDVGVSHKANLNAKTKLAGLYARIDTLEKGLRELGWHGISEGELQRRSAMIARLRDDHEKLTRMVGVARLELSRPSGGAQNNVPFESDREALFATGPKPVTRVFGAAAAPKETDETRPLDGHGLLGLQQDEQLSELTTIIRRQKQLGVAIANGVVSCFQRMISC